MLERVLKRDRAIVVAGIVTIAALTWFYMVREARSMTCAEICGADANAWSAAMLVPLFLMWAEMMVAMMTPSVAPVILAFAMINRRRREVATPFASTAVFLAGYLVAWTLFSLVAAVAQWALHSTLLLSPQMVLANPWVGGVLLLGAGIFQWTPLKHACLKHCRSPLSFLMTQWREGTGGAFTMGLTHGGYCTGCCWLLMTLLFVAGVMNLWWIAAISVFVLLEKVIPRGLQFGRVAGVVLAGWGTWLMVGAV